MMKLLVQWCVCLELSLLVNSLEGGSYGLGPDLSQASSSYKAAYAKARALREQQFRNKTEEGPAEQIFQETYQAEMICC